MDYGTKRISPERRARMRTGYGRAMQQRREWRTTPLLAVGKWIIFRLDHLRLVLARKDASEDRWSYYPSIADAATALLHEPIAETMRPGLNNIVEAVRAAEREVAAAVQATPWPSESSPETRVGEEGRVDG